MIVIVSGPINAGKSTVARQLSRLVPDSQYIDGDNLAPIDLPNVQKWATAIELISQATLSIAQTGAFIYSCPILSTTQAGKKSNHHFELPDTMFAA